MTPPKPSRRNDRSWNQSPSKLPLVYILSTGRSGSTLLDVLLGAQPACWTLGEFHLLDIGVGQHMQCGCRAQLSKCDFWGPILNRVRRTMSFPVGYFRSGRHPNGKVVRWNLLPSLLTGRPLPTQRSIADAYAASNLAALDEVRYAAAQQQEEMSWFIDASKDPYRLLWLQASGHFDIRVIHLIRRPEGFVSNMLRSANARDAGAVIKYTGRWLIDNLISLMLLRRMFSPKAVKTVHYEDLATNPEIVIGDLCHWLEVPFDEARTYGTRYDVNHGIGGNRPRWDALAVKLEETWRTTMPTFHQRLVSFLAAPLLAFRKNPEIKDAAWRQDARSARRVQPRWITSRTSR